MWTVNRMWARSLLVALFVLVLGGALVACGSDDGGDSTAETPASTEAGEATSDVANVDFTVGKFPAPLIIVAGEAMGSFDDLSMTLTELTGGAEALPLLTSGDLAGVSDVSEPPVAIGIVRNIGMKVVWQGNSTPITLLVDDSIQGPEDMEGKTFGDPAGSINHLKLLEYLEENGLSPDDINFVNMGAPEVAAAYKSGAINGTNIFPPFTEAIEAEGAHALETSNAANVLLMSDKFIEENHDVVQALVCDLAEIQEAAVANPKPAYQAIADYLELPVAEVPAMLPQELIVPLDEMTGPKYLGPDGEFAKNVVAAGEYMKKLGELEEAPTLEEANATIDLQFIEAAQNGECG